MSEPTVPETMRSMQSLMVFFPDACGHRNPEWLRAWPFGAVHFSEDWTTRSDGRFETVCGRTPIFWPECDWPEQEVCAECKAWVEEHGAHAHMQYAEPQPADDRTGEQS